MKDLIKNCELSQGVIANALGITRPTLWRKMNGINEWTMAELRALSNILGVEFTINKHGITHTDL